MSKNQKGFGAVGILAVVVAIGLIGAVGWYVYQATQNSDQSLYSAAQQDIKVADEKEAQSQPATQEDAYDDWTTYKSTKYGFEIKYPQGWQLVEEDDSNKRITFGQTKNIGSHGYDGEWGIWAYNESEKNVEDIIKEYGSQFESNRKEKRENIKVGELHALKAIITTSTISDWYSELIFIEQKGKLFQISNGARDHEQFNEFYGSFKLL